MTKRTHIEAIQAFLQTIFEPGDLFEIRALGSKKYGTMSMLGDDFFLAAKTAVAMEERGADVYYALNPIEPNSRYAKRVKQNFPFENVRFTATDKSMACRNLYLIDIDPIRPPGTAATDKHRIAAGVMADTVRDHLASLEWPEPIRIDSGNGIHLLYKGDRCSANGDILKYALIALARRFDGDCKVDLVTHNPARIARLPFTVNTKAGRRSRLLHQPHKFEAVPAGRIFRLGLEGGYRSEYDEPRRNVGGTLAINEDGVLRLISEFPQHLLLDRVSRSDGVTYFALKCCPFKGAPHRGQDVGHGKSTILLGPEAIGFKCFSDDCVKSFADLLRLLQVQTGRWPSVEIWADDLEALAARWPNGIDWCDPMDPQQEYLERCYDEGDWDSLPDGVAYQFLMTLRLPRCFDPRDPKDPMLPVIMAEFEWGQQRELGV